MGRKFGKIKLIGGTLVLLVVGWLVVYPVGQWRYRLTLVVETPEGMVTGSAVREVWAYSMPKILPQQHAGADEVSGEAVVVDLGKRGVLFALLRSEGDVDYGTRIVYRMFPYPPGGALTRGGIRYYDTLDGKAEVPFDKLPMLVRFREMNDPKTVEKVDPNDLEAIFGEGVRLVSATIEMTSDPVTRGVEERLTWLPQYYNKRLDGNRFGTGYAKSRLANDLSSGAFSTEASPYGR